MRRKYSKLWPLLFLGMGPLALAGNDIPHYVLAAGGTQATSAHYEIQAAIGQPFVDTATSAHYGLAAGYWVGAVNQPGDLNCDGVVDWRDIDPFVLALSDPAAYEAAYPTCDILDGDCNGDGVVNFADIDPFVALLSH